MNAPGEAQDDSPKEACGVFGVYAPSEPAAQYVYLGLYALQHRGQEAAGIAVSDGETITVVKEMGLVANAFDDRTLAGLTGHLGIGHTRYSTTGSSTWRNAQPSYRSVGEHEFALGHNGNLTNTEKLAANAGMLPGTVTSDSDLVAELLAARLGGPDDSRSDGRALERALVDLLPDLEGAFSLVIMDEGHVLGVRDPNGLRPLCLGEFPNGGWVLASETPALDLVGATFVRELDPGEMVIIDATGCRSVKPFPDERIAPRLCIFEFVYFARPDSSLVGRNIHAARWQMGYRLAEQAPVAADIVVPVPESGIPSAQGFSAFSRIPYVDGLVKNRYVGRTFIEPAQSMRDQGIRMKLNPIPDVLDGKRVALLDDSIVRGSTTRQLVQMVREAGASEIHLRISSPPYRWPCYYGMDTGDRSTLLAADRSVEEIRQFLEVDSLSYLDLDVLVDATGAGEDTFCTACLSGEYPTSIEGAGDKYLLERT